MKEIQLAKGGVAMVDDADFPQLSRYRWYLHPAGYAIRFEASNGSMRSYYMHRDVTGAPSGHEVDHVNRDKLDNRRENLRLCSRSQNNVNVVRASYPNSTGFRGVFYIEARGQWCAQIWANGRHLKLGRWRSPEDAARAYDSAARELHGEFAVLNFPDGEAPSRPARKCCGCGLYLDWTASPDGPRGAPPKWCDDCAPIRERARRRRLGRSIKTVAEPPDPYIREIHDPAREKAS